MGTTRSSPDTNAVTDDIDNKHLKAGLSCMQGWRVEMEDGVIAKLADLTNQTDRRKLFSIFAVFDGHSGHEVAQYCMENWGNILNDVVDENPYLPMEAAIRKSFFVMDERIYDEKKSGDFLLLSQACGVYEEDKKRNARKMPRVEEEEESKEQVEAEINKIKLELSEKGPDRHRNLVERCGSSAICAVIHGRTLFVANAGDSRAVLCRKDGVVVPLSEDHKPNLEREKKRIYSSGGYVSSGRVNGCLALSRGFGDFQYKNNGSIPPKAQAVTCDPDITVIELEKEHEFLIIACDGIWDCMSSEEACKYIQDKLRDLKQKSEYQQEEKTPLSSIITNMFLEKCLAEVGDLSEVGSDNMTCIVVLFNDDLFQEDQV